VAGTDAGQFVVRAGCPVDKPRNPSADLSGLPDRRLIRGALLFGYFLLGKQEKVTRTAAAVRNARRVGGQVAAALVKSRSTSTRQPTTTETGSRPAPGWRPKRMAA